MPANPLQQQLGKAAGYGMTLRLSGAELVFGHTDSVPDELLAWLKDNAEPLRASLPMTTQEADALRFFQTLGVQERLIEQAADVAAAVTALEADASAHGGHIGFDIETTPRPGCGPPVPWIRLTKTGSIAVHQPKPGSPAALDVHRANIALAQCYAGGPVVYLFRGEALQHLLSLSWLRQQRLAIHGAGFEIGHLRAHARRHAPAPLAPEQYGRIECTAEASALCGGTKEGGGGVGRALEAAAKHFLRLTPPKQLATSDWGAVMLSAAQRAYAATDALLAWQLWPVLLDALHRMGLWDAYGLQVGTLSCVADMEAAGLLLDVAEHDRQIAAWRQELEQAHAAFAAAPGGTEHPSPAKIRDWLMHHLAAEQLRRWPRTDKQQQLSTTRDHIKRLIAVPGAAPLLRLLELEKLLSGFGTALHEKITPVTGRIHPRFTVAGAKSGRLSCSQPNLQQFPARRAPELRRCIVARPGYLLIGADWNQVELRGVAWLSRDPVLTRLYEEGRDLHAELAAKIAGVPIETVTKEQRQSAKPVSFGAVYGISARGLAENAFADYGIVMSDQAAQQALEEFFNTFHVLARWRRDNARSCQAAGEIRIGLGRLVKAAWESSRQLSFPQCCNLPVQGICADAMMLALRLVHIRLQATRLDAAVIASIHDEILLEGRIKDADRAAAILESAMLDAFAYTFPGAPTVGLVTVGRGHNWAEVKS